MEKEFEAEEFKASLREGGELYGSSSERVSNPLLLAGRIIDRVRDGLSEYGCRNRDRIIAAAKDAYFELARVVDIPLVPATAETQIEQNLWDSYVDPTLQSVANTVCGPKKGASQ